MNLNEPLKRTQSEGEVISLESRRNTAIPGRQQPVSKREIEDLNERWTAIQADFVDNPRQAVEQADQLVASAIEQMTEGFRAEKSQLESRWNKEEASTEDLRVSLQHYRALFDRLLAL